MTVTFDTTIDELQTGKIYTGIYNSYRRAWFKYCYHFSHIENIVSILNDGYLFSRKEALLKSKMKNDNASSKIIDQTNPKYKEYVRLYFRPKSPTQYHNEGCKTKEQLKISELNAQCSVPVFLCLDIRKVLTHPGCLFTETSLASQGAVSLYSTPDEFSKLPYDKIYHDRAIMASEETSSIVGHRHAEIIVPDSLPLTDYLKKIVVRSPAEKETLLTMLSEDLKRKYEKLIQIDTSNILFYSRWTYFHSAQLDNHLMTFDVRVSRYNNNQIPIQFDVEVELVDEDGTVKRQLIENYSVPSKLRVPFSKPRERYEVTWWFDNQLMYKGSFRSEGNLPF